MRPGVVAYMYDGDTFVGSFETRQRDRTTIVSVRYKDATSCAEVHGLDAEIVARVLLGEMVRDDVGRGSGTMPRRERRRRMPSAPLGATATKPPRPERSFSIAPS